MFRFGAIDAREGRLGRDHTVGAAEDWENGERAWLGRLRGREGGQEDRGKDTNVSGHWARRTL